MMRRIHVPSHGRQIGTTLVISLIMLLMVMLVAVGLIRLSVRHTQVVNNEQFRSEAVTAANYALDQVLNKANTTGSWNVYKNAGTIDYVNLGVVQSEDIADDPSTNVKVQVQKLTCKRSRRLKNAELMTTDPVTTVVQVKDPADTPCIFGGSNSGLHWGSGGPPASSDSMCATVLWELQAQAQPDDPKLMAAAVPVVQGVEVRADIGTYMDACK
ncbi:MAG TPA: hypothetical protein VFP68_23935 [Burkholderiaceae bacterium]|nr:hypothetical protein [Burkholderiaceae bacterium]